MTMDWVENSSIPADDFDKRSIAKYKSGNVALIGMRRLGKTEYLKYRYQLLKNEISNTNEIFATEEVRLKNVIFLNFDDPIFSTINFKDVESESFNKLSLALLDLIEDPKYEIKLVLIDEIQRRKEWSKWIKGFVDRFGKKVTFVVTGSDSIEMSKSNEYGIDRFQTLYIGPLSFKEYVEMDSYFGEPDIMDYIDNHVFPSKELNNNLTAQFEQVIEKQAINSNANKENIKNVLRQIALNPGEISTPSKIKTALDENPDTKIGRSVQVDDILEFLYQSKLIIKLDNAFTVTRTSKTNKCRYYANNWNSYKFFSLNKSIANLFNNKFFNDTQKSGMIFENMVIANIISELHTSIEQSQIYFYHDAVKNIDADLFINKKAIEIKFFDAINPDDSDIKSRIATKANYFKKNECAFEVWHLGETKTESNVKYININQVLMESLWKI